MHLVDCHGIAELVYGGILSHLLSDARLGRSQGERLEYVEIARQGHYSERPGVHRLPKIFLKNVLLMAGLTYMGKHSKRES